MEQLSILGQLGPTRKDCVRPESGFAGRNYWYNSSSPCFVSIGINLG